MRILYVTPTDDYSGGEKVTLGIAKDMQLRGHTVAYCGLDGPIRSVVGHSGVPFICFKRFTPPEIRKAIDSFHPDLIHTMDFRASMYASLFGVPFVAHLHNNCPWLSKCNVNSLGMLFFAKRAKKIITVSKSIMDEYIWGGRFSDKTLMLPNMVDCDEVVRLSKEAEWPDSYDIAFIGRLTEQKQPLQFLKIVRKVARSIPQVKAVMIGAGELEAQIKEAVKQADLQNTVAMTGYLANPFPVLLNSRLVVMPSAWEGFGLTAVESMALGKPVLATSVGGLRDIVDDSCGKLRTDASALASDIVRLLTDEALYGTLSNGALLRVQKFCDSERYYSTVESLCRSIAGTEKE